MPCRRCERIADRLLDQLVDVPCWRNKVWEAHRARTHGMHVPSTERLFASAFTEDVDGPDKAFGYPSSRHTSLERE